MSRAPGVRDAFKPREYFDEHVRFNAQTLDEFREIIDRSGTSPEHRAQLRHSVYRRELEQLITRYSRGEAVAGLREAFPRAVDALTEYQQQAGRAAQRFEHFDAYVFALRIVSLAILLDVDDATVRRAVAELDNAGRDALYDRLVALRVRGGPQAATLLYPDPYEPLWKAIHTMGAEQQRLVAAFLERYYDGMQNAYWHNSHLRDDAGYFGYWCFELAAFVKALGIDDSSFADNPYYPSDFVHPKGSDVA
jgi:hypothetical protein